jgi:16S rRNA G1207 methylase RsmC
VAIEFNYELAEALRERYTTVDVYRMDFLSIGHDGNCLGPKGLFDRIVMNPPFADRQDIRHVRHALGFLKPGGRLVAIMSAGVTFREDRLSREFQALVDERGGVIEELPRDPFKVSGTAVRARRI